MLASFARTAPFIDGIEEYVADVVGKVFTGVPVKSEGATQSFATPVLDPSQAYFYMVRVEMVREGKPVSESRKVVVRAGQIVQETFNEQGILTASLKP